MQVLKLICGVSSNDNRLIPFAIFFPNPYVDPVCVFLPNVHKPDVNRIRKMVSFELGKEIEKDVFRLVRILSRTCILRPNCDRVLKRIESLYCAHKHHMVSEVVVYSFRIQEQFSQYLFAIY